mmetsp:Transcript_36059/g.75752  ORF Transcript_36059/g.75752 Transcript_36059/m.75752 type:complete len:202 (-) Transcript_36059:1912-2517(-)
MGPERKDALQRGVPAILGIPAGHLQGHGEQGPPRGHRLPLPVQDTGPVPKGAGTEARASDTDARVHRDQAKPQCPHCRIECCPWGTRKRGTRKKEGRYGLDQDRHVHRCHFTGAAACQSQGTPPGRRSQAGPQQDDAGVRGLPKRRRNGHRPGQDQPPGDLSGPPGLSVAVPRVPPAADAPVGKHDWLFAKERATKPQRKK